MSSKRESFKSRIGFILAATGAAVGLANIWAFPTQVASNGGGAFVLAYLVLSFLLAYPVLMAELLIGRHARSNPFDALSRLPASPSGQTFGKIVGSISLLTSIVILSFYSIVAGWMIAYMLQPMAEASGFTASATWLGSVSFGRNFLFTMVFIGLTGAILLGGVAKGIEKWSKRLMPALLILLLGMIAYVLTLEGAVVGLRSYLIPDFSTLLDPNLIISAMGQAFFSLSVGVGAMLIYGSYLSNQDNLPMTGIWITLADFGVAFLAGLLILPAMHVAQYRGIAIFAADGTLLQESTLIFDVLPSLFNSMGPAGLVVALAFFALLSTAALTSAIATMEVPIAWLIEKAQLSRMQATACSALCVLAGSSAILISFDFLFGIIVTLVTQYILPIMGLLFCVFAGWLWNRSELIKQIQAHLPQSEMSWFAKFWPPYVKFVCPLIIVVVFLPIMLGK